MMLILIVKLNAKLKQWVYHNCNDKPIQSNDNIGQFHNILFSNQSESNKLKELELLSDR